MEKTFPTTPPLMLSSALKIPANKKVYFRLEYFVVAVLNSAYFSHFSLISSPAFCRQKQHGFNIIHITYDSDTVFYLPFNYLFFLYRLKTQNSNTILKQVVSLHLLLQCITFKFCIITVSSKYCLHRTQ